MSHCIVFAWLSWDFILDLFTVQIIGSIIEDAYFRLAVGVQSTAKYKDAEQYYSLAISYRPDYWEVYQNRALVRGLLSKYDEAVLDLDTVIQNEPDNWAALIQRSFTNIQKGDLDSARADYELFLTLIDTIDHTEEISAAHRMAEALLLYDLNGPDPALTKANEAVQRAPDEPMAYFTRGGIYFQLNEYEKAVEDFNRAVALGLSEDSVYLMRGTSYRTMKDYSSAIDDLTNYLALYPEDAIAYYYRGIAYDELGDHQKALQDLDTGLLLTPTDPDINYSRSIVLYNLQDYQGSVEAATQSLDHGLGHVGAFYQRGISYYELTQYEEALHDFDQYIAMNGTKLDVYESRGGTHYMLRQFDLALQDYEVYFPNCTSPENCREVENIIAWLKQRLSTPQ